MSDFDRAPVSALHPSWVLVLLLVCGANTYHLFEFVASEARTLWAYGASALYVALFMALAIWGQVPRLLDRTLPPTTS